MDMKKKYHLINVFYLAVLFSITGAFFHFLLLDTMAYNPPTLRLAYLAALGGAFFLSITFFVLAFISEQLFHSLNMYLKKCKYTTKNA
jgi:hypothetical protein